MPVTEQEIEALEARITPEWVQSTVFALEPKQPDSNRGSVPCYELLDILTKGLPFSAASESSPVEVRLRRAIIDAVSKTHDLTFVESDG